MSSTLTGEPPPSLRAGRHGTSLLQVRGDGAMVEHRRLSLLSADPEARRHVLDRVDAVGKLTKTQELTAALPIPRSDLSAEVPWLELPIPPCHLATPPPGLDALTVWRAAAVALVSIHRLGFAHGHLCPSTIFLDGAAILLDATGLDCGQAAASEVGHCAAPEGVGLPGDVYSLGKVIAALVHNHGTELDSAHQQLLTAMQSRAIEERPSMLDVARTLGVQPTDPNPVEADAATVAGTTARRDRESHSMTAPNKLGRYEVVELLGKGGMGSVFQARDTVYGTSVAIKILNTGRESEQSLQRFFREARLLATISSPYVAKAIDANVDGNQHYLVMELLDGENLRQRIYREPHLDIEQALAWCTDLARGLTDIHKHGIVHRDVKPANVMLVERAGKTRAMLCDFGVARNFESTETQLTTAGALVGTPEFMAPEQVSGATADPRSDVYALGATLYTMLTGKTPFHDRKGVTALLAAQLQDDPPPVSQLRPEIGEPLEDLVTRAMAKNPLDRPMDAEALLEELEALLRGRPATTIESRPQLPDATSVRSYVVERVLEASVEELWPYVSNTDHMSRALGLGSVQGERRAVAGGIETYGTSNTFGFDLRWREYPFEWVAPTRFGVLREFTKGPLNWYRIIVDLVPEGPQRTKITHRIEAAPRGLFGEVAAWFELGMRTRPGLDRLYRRLEQVIIARRSNPTSFEHPYQKSERLGGARLARLESIETELHKRRVNEEAINRLGQALRQGNAQELARIRPRAFAKRHGLPEQDVLKTFLHASALGSLSMRWDVICPSCRIAAEMTSAMDNIRAHTNCDACGTSFDVNLSESLELVFQSHPKVRPCDPKTYCLGGPSHVPHIVSQIALGPKERFLADMSLEEGTYQVTGRGMLRHWRFRVDRWARSSRLDVALRAGFSLDRPRHVSAGKQRVTLANDFDAPMVVRIEKTADRSDSMTAAEVMTQPVFRRLFPEQVLSLGVQVSLSNVVALIVELADYPQPDLESGDLALFNSLSSLRTLVEAAVQREGGTAIKLYRSGLMAVFHDPTAGARAALHVVQEADENLLRLALTSGPAMATTINNRMDYFGRFVTRAEKLLSETPEGGLAISDRLLGDAGISELISRWRPRLQLERSETGGVAIRRSARTTGSIVPSRSGSSSAVSGELAVFDTPTP